MIILSSTNIDFGSVSRQQILTRIVTVYNTDIVSVDITGAVSSSVDYQVAPLSFTIDANGSKDIVIQYTADLQVTATGVITISHTAGPDVTIDVTAIVLIPTVNVDVTAWSFGNVGIDDSKILSRQITNTETNDSILTVAVISSDPNFIVLTPTLQISCGDTANIQVSLMPTSAGAKTATITIITNDLASPRTINASGTCIVPTYSVSPLSLSFGTIPINYVKDLTFTVSNTNTLVNLLITSITIADVEFLVLPATATIGPLASQLFTVSFEPETTSALSGNITLNSNAGSIVVSYTGTGTAEPIIDVDLTPIALGQYAVGIAETFSIIVESTGVVDLTITSITFPTVSGTTFTPSISLPYIVPHDSSVTIIVTVNSSAEANFSGNVTINSDAYNSPTIISISGDAQSPLAVINNTTLDFGTIGVSEQKQLTFTVENQKDVDLQVTITDLQNFVASPDSFIVAGNSIEIVTVTFSINSPGTASGIIVLTTNDIAHITINVNVSGSANLDHAFVIVPESIENNFLTVNVTSTSEVSIINNSLLPVSVDSLEVTNYTGITTSYTISTTNLPVTLGPGEVQFVELSFLATTVGKVGSTLKFKTRVGVDLQFDTAIIATFEGEVFAPTISLSTSSLSFGSVAIGVTQYQTLTVTNLNVSAGLHVKLTIDNDNFHFKDTVNEILTIAKVDSKYIATTANSKLVLSSITMTDDLTGVPLVLGDPSVINEFSVNSDTGVMTFNAAMLSRVVRVSYDYKLSEIEVDIVDSSSINVGFSPKQAILESGIMTVESNDLSASILTVSLSGTGINAVTSIAKINDLVDFIAKVNQTVTQKVVLKNTGNVTVFISSIDVITPFSVTNQQFGIDPNELYELDIVFSPTNNTTSSQNIVIHSNAPDLSIAVIGEGQYPVISLPSSFDFDDVGLNLEKEKILTISNTSDVDLDVELQLTSTIFTVSPTSFTVLANNSYDATVTFKPLLAQAYTEKIKILSDDILQPEVNFEIMGTGVEKPIIDVTQKLEFSDTTVNDKNQLVLSVSNIGTLALQITSIHITSGAPAYSGNFAPTTINPGASHSYTVTFQPTINGRNDGNIRIISNDTDRPQVDIVLVGQCIVPDGSWVSFTLDKMIPQALLSGANAVKDVITPLQTILSLIKSIFNIVKIFLVDISSPLKIILQALFTVINKFVLDFKNAGIYVLPIFPSTNYQDPTIKADNGFAKWLASIGGGSQKFKQKVIDSFDDIYDSRRPQFSSDAHIGAIVVAVDSGNVADVVEGIIALANIFTSLKFEPKVQEPQNVEAVSDDGYVTVRWEIPEFVTFNIGTFFNKQPLIDLMYGFEVYRSTSQSQLAIATQDYYNNAPVKQQIAWKGDVIDLVTKAKVNPIKTVLLREFNFRFENFAVGFRDTNPTAPKNLGYEYKDEHLDNGKSYFYTVRSLMSAAVAGRNPLTSPLSTEVVGSPRALDLGPAALQFLNRCVNFYCSAIRENQKIPRVLSSPVVKLIDQTGIIQQVESRTEQDKILTDAGQRQVNTFTIVIDKQNINIANLIVRNTSEAQRRIDKNKIKITGIDKIKYNDVWDDNAASTAEGKDQYFQILNQTKLIPGWDLLVMFDRSTTILTINDVSNIGYKSGDSIVVEYYDGGYSASCKKQLPFFDPPTQNRTSKCANGANKGICPQYSNARCIYHTGFSCSNVGFTNAGSNRSIPNKNFFDVNRCQDSSMGGSVNFLDLQMRNDPNYSVITTGVCAGYMSLKEQSIGTYPDWMSFTLQAYIKPVEDFLEDLQGWINREIDAIQKGSSSVAQFIELMEQKIDALQQFISQIEHIINVILSIFSSRAGFYLLAIESRVGVEGIKNSIQNAANGPSSGQNGWTAGTVILVGGPNFDVTWNSLRLFFPGMGDNPVISKL
ncbi:MAG: choice-of-anchor D domain-containing protein [Nitrosarchaeum sp.]|nr:choice-of-anchor D domain-containing protein [Nitrosarchaeum sp.]